MTDHRFPPLILALQDQAIYPHPCENFEIIETHISWVLLTGPYVYKIKKPLNLGFLDFSTLAKRHLYCQEELRLNSRLAPQTYLEVIEVRGAEDAPQLNGNQGPIIEYAVKMRQFDRNNTFDHLIEHGQLTLDHIRQTADLVADFHRHIAQSPNDTHFGNPAAVMQPIRENFSQIKQLKGIEQPALLHEIANWSECAFQQLHTFIRQRKQEGFVRECHGDLHLANIALINNDCVPFDGIEFNPSLYWIDVINDAAFLVMDLIDKQRTDLAFQFLNVYLQHRADYAGLKLLRFYLVYRAMVRAKVSAIRACQSIDAAIHQQALADYHRYLKLAARFTRPTKPTLLIMHGLSGSGKSWLSERMLERIPCIRVRSDIERKRLFGLSLKQSNQHAINLGPYSALASTQTYRRLHYLARNILLAGCCAIVDATFLQRTQRQPFLELAEEFDAPIRIIATHSHPQILRQRIEQRAEQHDNVSDADLEVLEHQQKNQQPLTEEELQYCIEVDTQRSDDLDKLWRSLDEFKH